MSHTMIHSEQTGESRLDGIYAECRRQAQRHYENFPVASYLVPRDKRDALAAIYCFARGADDFADEPSVSARLERLARWREQLEACYACKPAADGPVFLALADTVRRHGLSREYFEKLVQAFESDVRVNRHPNFESLLAYSACSANPVGRLVLELFGHREPELVELSDCICTALQLTNFWQDVRVDLERNRVYLPAEDLERFGVSLDHLRRGLLDERWRRLMAVEIGRTRELFDRGRELPEKVTPELRRQLRLTWLGGTTVLDRIEAVEFDVFSRRPKLSRLDFARLFWRAARPLPPRPNPDGVRPAETHRGGQARTT